MCRISLSALLGVDSDAISILHKKKQKKGVANDYNWTICELDGTAEEPQYQSEELQTYKKEVYISSCIKAN